MNLFRNTVGVITALLISANVSGQGAKRTSAYNYLGYGELDNAMEAIEPTTEHERTKDDPKTWMFRGKIYQAIYETKEEKYQSLHQNPLQVAFESFMKCIELDEKGRFTDEALKYLDVEGKQFINEGINRYNGKDYGGALQAFENTIKASNLEGIERTDSLAIYYAGACSELLGELEKAEKYYRQSIDIGYKAEGAYVRMVGMYSNAGNSEKAFEILKEGREKFPKNQALVTEEVNVYLKNDQHAEAMEALEVAIENEPENASLHFALGFVNDRLAASMSAENPEGGAEYDKHVEAAKKSYAKAVELDDSNFDAVYNLGALYFNQAVKMVEVANGIDDTKKYEAAKAEAEKVFDQALPILEDAYELNPDDKGVLISLKQLYYRKMVEDESYKKKYDEIMERMK